MSWLAEARAQLVLERTSVYEVSEGPASGATLKVCAELTRLETVRVRIAVLAAVTIPKSSSDILSASGSAGVVVAGTVNDVDARPEAETVRVLGTVPLSVTPH